MNAFKSRKNVSINCVYLEDDLKENEDFYIKKVKRILNNSTLEDYKNAYDEIRTNTGLYDLKKQDFEDMEIDGVLIRKSDFEEFIDDFLFFSFELFFSLKIFSSIELFESIFIEEFSSMIYFVIYKKYVNLLYIFM
jgi:hypothetical protein